MIMLKNKISVLILTATLFTANVAPVFVSTAYATVNPARIVKLQDKLAAAQNDALQAASNKAAADQAVIDAENALDNAVGNVAKRAARQALKQAENNAKKADKALVRATEKVERIQERLDNLASPS